MMTMWSPLGTKNAATLLCWSLTAHLMMCGTTCCVYAGVSCIILWWWCIDGCLRWNPFYTSRHSQCEPSTFSTSSTCCGKGSGVLSQMDSVLNLKCMQLSFHLLMNLCCLSHVPSSFYCYPACSFPMFAACRTTWCVHTRACLFSLQHYALS